MTINEMKETLADKLRGEGTYFTESDISITETETGYNIVIKDYEHIPFTVTLEEDESLGKCVLIAAKGEGEIAFDCERREYPVWDCLLQLGYWIGTRF